MSLSPSTTVSNGNGIHDGSGLDHNHPQKRRRTSFSQHNGAMLGGPSDEGMNMIPPGHIPKRGQRACTACRKGKNRCEGEVSLVLICLFRTSGRVWPSRCPPAPPGPEPLMYACRLPVAAASLRAPRASLRNPKRKMGRSWVTPVLSTSFPWLLSIAMRLINHI